MRTFEEFLVPKEIEVFGYSIYISLFTAIEGREIVSNYVSSNVPKIGNYKVSEEMMLKLMSFVACVDSDGNKIVLNTRALINSHLKKMSSPWEALLRIEAAVMEYNCSFFQKGQVSTFFDDIARKVRTWTTSTLTDSLAQLLQKEEQPSESSEQSIV